MDVSQQSVEDLLGNAVDTGILSNTSMSALDVHDIGQQISEGLHVDVDNITTSRIGLVSLLVDDSSSIYSGGNVQQVIDGHNQVLDSLLNSQQSEDILMHTRYLNGDVLYRYTTLDQALRMDTNNYNPSGGTPLYDQTVVMLGTVLAQTQAFLDTGRQCYTITVIVTDGADMHSTRHRNPESVAPILQDALDQENHIIAGIGINDGHTNFRDIFERMGIPPQWILTPGNSESEIRNVWQLTSRMATRASQSSQAFSNSLMGGFEL